MGEPIRVLQLVTQMNRGGMENRLMDIYRAVDRTRVQFDFYTLRSDKGQFDEEIRSLGGRVFYGSPLSPKHLGSIPRVLCAFCTSHPEYRIVHAHQNQWCGLLLEGARRAGVPVRIAHARTALPAGGNLANRVKNTIKRLYRSAPTHRFAVSEKAGLWLFGAARLRRGEVTLLPNAIDAQKFLFSQDLRQSTREALLLGDAYTVLHVGNLRAVKNHEYLFSVFAEVKKSVPDACLLLAGTGEREAALRQKASRFGQDVLFLGSRDDIPALLSAADAFVFPSFYEGLPGAVLEAQASSLPCFFSDTIAPEVRLSELAEPLSIFAPPAVWANHVLASRDHVRQNEFSLFEKTGYDVHSLAGRLTEFYLEANASK